MISVILADDNKFALKHFAGLVDWEKFGFQLVATAVDGIEAWNKFCRLSPDVVITDVQMPGIDGIELVRRIRERKSETVVIFLSSYDEFDYARSAIDLSVQEYILKQELDKKTFERKLTEIGEFLRKRTEKTRKMAIGHLTTFFHAPMEEVDPSFCQEIFPVPFLFFVVEQDRIPEVLRRRSGYETQEADYRVLMAEAPKELPRVKYLLHVEPYRWIGFVEPAEDAEHAGEETVQYFSKKTGGTFSLLLFPEAMTVYESRKMYEKMKFFSEQRYFEGTNVVMYAEMYEEQKNAVDVCTDEFAEAMQKNEIETALRALDQIFRPIMRQYDFAGFENALDAVLEQMEDAVEKRYGEFLLYEEGVQDLLSVRRIVRWLKGQTTEILELKGKEQYFKSDAMDRAVRFIYQEYANSLLSVEDIAQKAELSVNRLNDLFKKEQGETVGRFLTRVRMEKAKELLERGEKIPDVVRDAGYASASYFSKVFRKMYDVSPQEYRRRGKRDE